MRDAHPAKKFKRAKRSRFYRCIDYIIYKFKIINIQTKKKDTGASTNHKNPYLNKTVKTNLG